MLRVQSVLIHSLFSRARARGIGGRSEGSHREWSGREGCARIERERTPWGDALARLLRAGIGSVSGDRAAALAHVTAAERDLAAADMALHAAVAGRRRGELLGGAEGAAAVAAADAWMAGQGIRNPARIAGMLAPGTWS